LVGVTEIFPRLGKRWYSRAASRKACSAAEMGLDKGVSSVCCSSQSKDNLLCGCFFWWRKRISDIELNLLMTCTHYF
jgi:hypothetical protein